MERRRLSGLAVAGLIVQVALLVQWLILIGLGISEGLWWLTGVGGAGCAVGTAVAWVILTRRP